MGSAHKKGGNRKKNVLDQIIENQSQAEKRRKAAERKARQQQRGSSQFQRGSNTHQGSQKGGPRPNKNNR